MHECMIACVSKAVTFTTMQQPVCWHRLNSCYPLKIETRSTLAAEYFSIEVILLIRAVTSVVIFLFMSFKNVVVYLLN